MSKLAKIALAAAFGFAICFAQNVPEKLAVYASGASDAGVNRLLGGKLLSAMSQGGKYAEIADPAVFQEELAKSGKGDLSSIAQAAKRHGAELVCVVSMTEAFGAYSITARLVRVSDLQVLKTGSADRALKSLDDLTAVSNELARQLLPGSSAPPAPAAPVAAAAAPLPFSAVLQAASAPKECDEEYNINELLSKVKSGFPSKLKDCSSTLAKDMLNPFGKKLEPKSFMMQCPIDGIKKELPAGFPNTDKIVGSLTTFVQGLLNSALAGGSLDPKKLVSAVGSMDIDALLSDLRKAAADECIVDKPYEPPVASAPSGRGKERNSGEEKDKGSVSFGIRAGINFSHTYADYNVYSNNGYLIGSGSGDYGDILGMQAGFVVDFPVSDWFHIQPGLMYAQKGMDDEDGSDVTAHYIELPLLLSFKISALRLNAGPYFGYCLTSDYGAFKDDFDLGLSTGIGFDIGMFYIGAFYDYGFFDVSDIYGYNFYNRTLGFNLGINL
jgi:hypothetical protein